MTVFSDGQTSIAHHTKDGHKATTDRKDSAQISSHKLPSPIIA